MIYKASNHASLPACLALFITSSFLFCQNTSNQLQKNHAANTSVAFSVVSVRPSDTSPGVHLGVYNVTPSGVIERNNSLLWLIQLAYGMPKEDMVIGFPLWSKEQDFDVLAKVDPLQVSDFTQLSQPEQALMLRAVLEDRFKLRSHFEPRETSQFGLLVSKHGPKFAIAQPSQSMNTERVWKIQGRYSLEARNATMSDLCSLLLSTEAREIVVDETGLTGKYDFTLRWSRDTTPKPAGSGTSPAVEDAPDIFTAVKDQLGLQMVRRRVPSQVLVIEHVEAPSLN